MSDVLIERDFAIISIAKNRAYLMEVGKEDINKLIECYNPSSFLAGFDYGMELAQKILSSLPIAYDLDKVVKQLECSFFYNPRDPIATSWNNAIKDAIEIVRKGGAE